MNDGVGLNTAALLPSRIKRIQRGTITLSGTTSGTATITAVDTNKTVLVPLGITGNVSSTDLALTYRVDLTASTTVTATRTVSTGDIAVVGYQVVEYV